MAEIRSGDGASVGLDLRYDRMSIALHWGSAGTILLNWVIGQFHMLAPRGAPRVEVISTHILIGLAVGLMLLARLAWRAGPGRRLGAEPGWQGPAAQAAHAGLYGLIGMTVLAGASHTAEHGLNLFGVVGLPGFDFWTLGPLWLAGKLRGKLADALVVLAGLHALAALGHHVLLGDGILLRMAPALARGGRRESGDE